MESLYGLLKLVDSKIRDEESQKASGPVNP
jgi:hypothetical protein